MTDANVLQHEHDLIAAAVEPWRTDCSTPVFQMVRNAVAEVEMLRKRCRKAELEGGWAVDPSAYVEREKYEALQETCRNLEATIKAMRDQNPYVDLHGR